MKISNINIIKSHEGLRLKAYMPTPNDVWTIGYGHTKGVKPGMVITEKQAEQLLREDLDWVEEAIARNVKVPLNQNQYDALASWVFNLGEGNLKSSTLLRKLNKGDYEGAANEFPRWNKQKGTILRGLTRRRAEERELFLTPVSKTTSQAVSSAVVGVAGSLATLAAEDINVPVAALVGLVAAGLVFLMLKLKKD